MKPHLRSHWWAVLQALYNVHASAYNKSVTSGNLAVQQSIITEYVSMFFMLTAASWAFGQFYFTLLLEIQIVCSTRKTACRHDTSISCFA